MFSRFRTHALPRAGLMFTSGITEGSAVGYLEGDPLYHGSLNTEEYRSLLDAAGFDVIDHVTEDPTCGHRNVWLARQRS